MGQSFSPIQNDILSRLKNASSLRYSELHPGNIPNDLFNYHLQFLVKKGFLLKTEDGYALSPSGIQHIADPFLEKNGITSLFKMNVITIVSRNGETGIEILNQERQSNPSYGKVGVMGGVVLKGESILQAASRKLKEETGLEATFQLMGCERRIMYVNHELFSDVVFPIAYAQNAHGVLVEQTQFGRNKWVSIEEAILNDTAEFDTIPAITKVLRAIRDDSINEFRMFFDETIQNSPATP